MAVLSKQASSFRTLRRRNYGGASTKALSHGKLSWTAGHKLSGDKAALAVHVHSRCMCLRATSRAAGETLSTSQCFLKEFIVNRKPIGL